MGINLHLAQGLHAADIFENVHADRQPSSGQTLLFGIRVNYGIDFLVRGTFGKEVEGWADGVVMHIQVLVGLSTVQKDRVSFHSDLGQPGVLEGQDCRQEEGVDQVTIVI